MAAVVKSHGIMLILFEGIKPTDEKKETFDSVRVFLRTRRVYLRAQRNTKVK